MMNLLLYLIPVIIMIIFFVLLKDLFINNDKDPLVKRFNQKRLKSIIKRQLHHRKNAGYLGSHFSL